MQIPLEYYDPEDVRERLHKMKEPVQVKKIEIGMRNMAFLVSPMISDFPESLQLDFKRVQQQVYLESKIQVVILIDEAGYVKCYYGVPPNMVGIKGNPRLIALAVSHSDVLLFGDGMSANTFFEMFPQFAGLKYSY